MFVADDVIVETLQEKAPFRPRPLKRGGECITISSLFFLKNCVGCSPCKGLGVAGAIFLIPRQHQPPHLFRAVLSKYLAAFLQRGPGGNDIIDEDVHGIRIDDSIERKSVFKVFETGFAGRGRDLGGGVFDSAEELMIDAQRMVECFYHVLDQYFGLVIASGFEPLFVQRDWDENAGS